MTRRCLMPGCKRASKPRGDYCSDSHRAAAHKLRKRLGGLLPAERRRVRDAASKRAARAGGVIPSDVRISFLKAIDAVTLTIEQVGGGRYTMDESRDIAFEALYAALPERLRESV